MKSIWVCLAAVLLGGILPAQEAVNYGTVGGRVSDPSGAVVEGARVVARQVETGVKSESATGQDGRFRFPFLRVGEYEIAVRLAGFTESVTRVSVTVGSAFDMPVTLALASSDTNVVVTGEGAVLEAARTQIAATVSHAEVRDMPLNGRNFLDLALLVPGVAPANTGSNQLFAETSAVPGQGLSIGSQRNFSNNFIVDGLSANDDAAGLSGIFYGLDVVQEFQVVTSGGHAELGRALGGYINMVTRSGANALHGDLYGYFRNQRLNAANPLSNSKLPITQSQYGASLGGPVTRDRTFYFANFEQRLLNQSGLVTIAPANVEVINARLAAIGYPGSSIATGVFSNPAHGINFLGKIDHQLSGRNQMSARYSLYNMQSANSRGAGGLNAVTSSAGLDNRDQTLAVSNVGTISARTVNETRAQVTFSSLQAPPSDPVGPAVNIAGVATFGTLAGAPTARQNRLYEITDSVSHQAAAHSFRAGADFLFNDCGITYPRSVRGSYNFGSLADFLSGTYSNSGFTQTFGDSSVSQKNPNLGLYAQDEWKVSSRLTLNLGLRYDLQWLESIATDRNNLSPRAGFAWMPFRSRRTVVRGGFGLFYDRVPLRAVANALLSAANTTDVAQLRQISLILSPGQAGAPAFPQILRAPIASVTLVNFSTMARNIGNAYSEQGSFEIEQQLGNRATLSAGYEHLRGIHLIASINQNVPRCVASGGNNGCRPNAGFANNNQYSAAADSRYDALHVSLVQQPSKWGHYRLSYTWSKALNNVGENFFSSPIDPGNIWLDYGRSDDDQRHRVVLDGAVHTSLGKAKNSWERLTHGFQLSGAMQYYSALPMNITSGVTTVQGTAGRPLVNGAFLPRNAGTGNDLWSISARLSRTVQLRERLQMEVLAEAFNTLNHRNNLTRNGNFGAGAYPTRPASTFGQVTAVNDPRSMQLAMRLRF